MAPDIVDCGRCLQHGPRAALLNLTFADGTAHHAHLCAGCATAVRIFAVAPAADDGLTQTDPVPPPNPVPVATVLSAVASEDA